MNHFGNTKFILSLMLNKFSRKSRTSIFNWTSPLCSKHFHDPEITKNCIIGKAATCTSTYFGIHVQMFQVITNNSLSRAKILILIRNVLYLHFRTIREFYSKNIFKKISFISLYWVSMILFWEKISRVD